MPSNIKVHRTTTTSIDVKEQKMKSIRALDLPSYPIEDCTRAIAFTCTEIAMRTLIAPGVSSLHYKMYDDSPREQLARQVFSISLERKPLYTSFRTVCNQAVNNRKKIGRDVYFDELEYTSIYRSRNSSVYTMIYSLMFKNVECMYQESILYNAYGVCDSSS